MTPEELDFILKNGEGYRTEFKERLSSSLTKKMCAFANASGGTVFLGVSDDGKITGCTLDNAVLFIMRNTRLRYEIKDVQCKDIPEVPEEAVCESIVNAVLHRDYMITGVDPVPTQYRPSYRPGTDPVPTRYRLGGTSQDK